MVPAPDEPMSKEEGGVEMRPRMIALFAGMLIAVCCAGCSFGGSDAQPQDSETVQTSVCEPACCCRFKENYYVRFRCALDSVCEGEGGRCVYGEAAKCRAG